MNEEYVHGYSERESFRLYDQASTLTELLHHDTIYPKASRVLEAGCGVGAQTIILSENNPDVSFTSIDISSESIKQTEQLLKSRNITNVTCRVADIFDLPFDNRSFDHIFICFVLEHLKKPEEVLICLSRVLKPGGTITIIEGDHGSTYFYPDSKEAQAAIRCQVQLQAEMGGNSLIGRQIYPLLDKAGYSKIKVSPRMVYADASRPTLMDGFIKKTFTAMIEGVKDQALSKGLIAEKIWNKGIKDLYRTSEPDGVFCYTFFKGIGYKASA